MTLLEKAVEMTGWAPELIRDKLCPSDLEMEEDRYTINGCEVLKELGSCRACWGREVESGLPGVSPPTDEMGSGDNPSGLRPPPLAQGRQEWASSTSAPAGRTEPLPPAAPPQKGEAK